MKVAYHYTVCSYWPAIRASGVLLVASEHVPAGERAAVWFSTRREYEPTAYKRVGQPDGSIRFGGYADLFAFGGGALRFGLAADRLVAWPEHRRTSGLSPQAARDLERAARAANSNPRDWYVSYEPIAIEACMIECQRAPYGPWEPIRWEPV